MKFKIIVFILLTISVVANGQNTFYKVSGLVLNKITKSPVSDAYVTNSKETVQTYSDGKYILEKVRGGKNILTAMTYNNSSEFSTEVFITSDTTINLYVDNIYALEEFVITGTRTAKRIKDTPVITQVITAKQVTERGISDVKDLLMQEVPGLNFQEVGFGTAIDIQGLSSSHILFLIDGERIAGENGGNIDYSRINLNDIDRIEIVKGASSSLYGSQAMGGVINIISKQAKSKIDLNLNFRYAGLNQRNFKDTPKNHSQYNYRKSLDIQNMNANINIGFNLGRLKMNSDIAYKGFDGYQLYDSEPIVKYFPKYDITIKEPIKKLPMSISSYQDMQLAHRMSYKISNKVTAKANIRYYHLNKHDFVANNIYDQTIAITHGASVLYDINKNSNINFSIAGDNYSRYDKYESKEGRSLDYKNNYIQPRITHNHTFNKKQTLSSGVEYYRESLYGDMFDGSTGIFSTKDQWVATIFIQDDWIVSDKFSLIAGFRADYHEEYGFNPVPKLSAMYKLSPVRLRLNYAQGFRTPSLKELYMDWDHLGMFWIYGNDKLKPERNNYVSFSQEYNSRWLDLTVNLYGNWFKNKIEGVWTDDQTALRYTNIGKSRLLGVETMATLKIKTFLNVVGSYSYLNVSENEGMQLSSASPHTGSVRFENYINRNKKFATTLNFTAMFTGSKTFDVLDEIEIDEQPVEAYYSAGIAGYAICNFSVAQRLTKMVTLTAGVNNIFNYKSPIISFNSSTSPGRIYHVSIIYNFNKK